MEFRVIIAQINLYITCPQADHFACYGDKCGSKIKKKTSLFFCLINDLVHVISLRAGKSCNMFCWLSTIAVTKAY